MGNAWKYGLAFLGGMVAGALVYKNSAEIRAVCIKAMGGLMDLKDKAMETAETVKESTEDFLAEADAARRAANPA
jgi:hypothetical protein